MIRLAMVVLALLPPAQEEEGSILIKNARIITGTGVVIPNGWLVVANGRIALVNENGGTRGPQTVVDLGGKIVIPGLIDAGCTLGVAGPTNEEADEVSPQVRIVDALDPRSPDLARARQNGVTAAFVAPGNRSVIGGVASVIKTAGPSRASMIVREEAAMKAVIGPGPTLGNFSPRGTPATFFARRPTTRMGVAWAFRKAFFDARRYGEEPHEKDPGKELLLLALGGKLPVRIASTRVTDVETALNVAEELGLTISFEEAQEAYKRADALAKKKIPVLLRPSMLGVPPFIGGEAVEVRLDAFVLLTRAGVKTALLSTGDQLLPSVAFAVRHGAAPADALRAVTLTPAEILGVADRMGSLEKGKDADLVVLSGEPHEVTTRVEKVMIGGRWVFGDNR